MKSLYRYLLCLILLVPIIPVGCELTSDGDCRCDEIDDYEVIDLNQAFVLGSDPEPATDTVAVPDIGVRINFELETVSRTATLIPWFAGITPQAMACTCVGAFVRTQVASLSIVSASPVNENIPAGSELIDLFHSDIPRLEDGSFAIDLHHILRQSGDDSPEGVLSLQNADLSIWNDQTVHLFTVRFTLSDGQTFEQTLNPIRLVKG